MSNRRHRHHRKSAPERPVAVIAYVPKAAITRNLETRCSAEDLKRIARRLDLPVSGTKHELAMSISWARRVRRLAR